MTDYTKELGEFLQQYTSTHSISLLRENPRDLASRISKAFLPLFFSSEGILEGLKEKALGSLWNIVIDDIIEYTEKGSDNILDSMEALIKFRKREQFKARTESGLIMHDFIQGFYDLPPGPNKAISEELVFLDIVRVINGFDYERIIHENDSMGTLSEYMEFGVITIDMRIDFDIDMAIYPHELDPFTIRNLREAYRWFGMAFKLSSDVATFEREYFIEKSQNAVILYGVEKGLLPQDILKAEQKHKEEMFKKIIPSLMNEIEEKAKEFLSISLKCLDEITEIDTDSTARAFESMCKDYPGHRDFLSTE